MGKREKISVQAFTILEVTIVVAILSVLITIITGALNRFNEQLKVNTDIQAELNNWMLVRSNFWTEYHMSDSVGYEEEQLFFYQPHRTVCYKAEEDRLMRKEIKPFNGQRTAADEWMEMNVDIASIREDTTDRKPRIILTFPLKGDDMELTFFKQQNKADYVNQYYEQLNE